MDVKEKDIGADAPMGEAEVKKKRAAEKNKTGAVLTNLCAGALYALCAYFLGGAALPYGAEPLGVAFLTASDRRVFYIYAGLVLSAWQSERRLLLIGVYSSVLVLRILTRLLIDPPWKKGEETGERTLGELYPYLFSEHIALRACLAAVGAFAIGAHRLIGGGMLYYDMYGTVISALSAPAAVLVTGGFFKKETKKYQRLAGLLALSFGVIYSIGDMKLYGISVAAFGCMMTTLYISKTEGAVTGALSGALLGLAVRIGSAPIFAFSGLVSGLLFPTSAIFALLGALTVGVAWGVYSEGLAILNGTLSALVSATLIFGMWDRLSVTLRGKNGVSDKPENEVRQLSEREEGGVRYRVLLEAERMKGREIRQNLSGISEGLSSVSELLYNMSGNQGELCYTDIKQICDRAFEDLCCSCDVRESCWGEKYRRTSDSILGISSALQRKGEAELSDAGEELTCECGRIGEILSQINHNTAMYKRRAMENDRCELFASEFESFSGLIGTGLENNDRELLPDEILSRELERRLVELGVCADGACVFGCGRRCAVIFCEDTAELSRCERQISECVAELFGSTVSAHIDQKDGVMRIEALPRLNLSYAKRSNRAEGEEEFCGDTSGFFTSDRHTSYAFICDGMGAGREAAMTSGMCGVFLRGLLSSGGADTESVLRLLNGFLRNRGGGSLHECSSTVDLMEIDPYTCRARFYKSGAAPTYVYRNGSLFKLRSHTVPVGIIKELDLRQIELELSEGDLVVMVSDGVTDGREECPWLFDLIRTQSGAEPERLCELIVKYAKSEGATDDVTVLVIKPHFYKTQ